MFLLKHGNDLLIVQIYVDDIIFGGSSHDLVAKFADDMSREFEMSMMGELQFFLGLQIKQVKDGTFVHQGKYTKDMLKKFGMNDSKPLSTPMSTTAVMDADEDGEPVPEAVPKHDRLPPVLNGDEAGHTVQCVSVRSFSGFSKDFTLAGRLRTRSVRGPVWSLLSDE